MSHPTGDSHHADFEDNRIGGLNFKTYLGGFIAALILTAIPFAAVAFGWASPGVALVIIAVSAVVQILVHLFCFLHLNFSAENAWNAGSGAFTVLILAVLVGGTLWLMYSLEFRTMVGGMGNM